ncbi:hypothetical protein F1C58_03250 [Glaciihabitans sp. INWT7]|uniref:hypothetical protein n=1 Tax=Glaciihabitans sp. INWT7 TaxID=2596912 RepID=UPI00162551A4|nr:hypothetical protein [Glaciihabitans sp. INWT7]QNE46021.1 hypothetical protein F1C58_03250 [Glaciihabitans sp. INWT7]
MRWDNLFDDLEGQLEQELGAEEIDLRAEEERLRLGRLSLRERLQALSLGEDREPVRVCLTNGVTLGLSPRTFGRDWVSGDVIDASSRHAQFILPLDAIAGLRLSRAQVAASLEDCASPESGRGLSGRLGLAFVLRDLCRRRQAVELVVQEGIVTGTIDRVGRDHLDLAVHELGTARRERLVSHYQVVPFSRMLLLRL